MTELPAVTDLPSTFLVAIAALVLVIGLRDHIGAAVFLAALVVAAAGWEIWQRYR